MPLDTEVGLGLCDTAFAVDPATPRKKAHPPYPIFGPCLLWPNGWMDEDAACYGSIDLGRDHFVLDGVPASAKGAQHPPSLFGHVLWPRSPISATAELLYKRSPNNRLII